MGTVVQGRKSTWLVTAVLAMTVAAALMLSGYVFYSHAREDALRPVDAIIVLGGENDGRVPYGLALAKQGLARQVVISNPHGTSDPGANEGCAVRDSRFTVTCFAPSPSTTRGEAEFTRTLAEQNRWTSILLVSWRYHLPRARYIFERCFAGDIAVRAVPRGYHSNVAKWAYTYAYQTAGFVKAALQRPC